MHILYNQVFYRHKVQRYANPLDQLILQREVKLKE